MIWLDSSPKTRCGTNAGLATILSVGFHPAAQIMMSRAQLLHRTNELAVDHSSFYPVPNVFFHLCHADRLPAEDIGDSGVLLLLL